MSQASPCKHSEDSEQSDSESCSEESSDNNGEAYDKRNGFHHFSA